MCVSWGAGSFSPLSRDSDYGPVDFINATEEGYGEIADSIPTQD